MGLPRLGHRGPTPEDAWRQNHVTAAQRRQLQATVNRYFDVSESEKAWDWLSEETPCGCTTGSEATTTA